MCIGFVLFFTENTSHRSPWYGTSTMLSEIFHLHRLKNNKTLYNNILKQKLPPSERFVSKLCCILVYIYFLCIVETVWRVAIVDVYFGPFHFVLGLAERWESAIEMNRLEAFSSTLECLCVWASVCTCRYVHVPALGSLWLTIYFFLSWRGAHFIP